MKRDEKTYKTLILFGLYFWHRLLANLLAKKERLIIKFISIPKFQFHEVQLKVGIELFISLLFHFQFLWVQLEVCYFRELHYRNKISIPLGSIRRYGKSPCSESGSNFNSIGFN